MKGCRHQQGQVLPLGIVLVSVVAVATLVLFNTGQVAHDKMKLANAADAAAYSGALWQARALNFQAYTNRAMVANQVSMAQALSLQSWATYGAVASENLASVLKPIPVINAISAGIETGFTAVNQVVSPLVKGLLPVVSLVNQGLSKAQTAVYASTVVATSEVVDSVVAGNDMRFSIRTSFNAKTLSENLQAWQRFTTRVDNRNVSGMQRRQKIVNASLDDFSRQRNWEFFNFWFYSRPFLRHKVIRRGATRLNSIATPTGMQWQWQSEDTVSLHNKISRIGGSKRVEIPIGWAGAVARSDAGNRANPSRFCVNGNDEYCQALTDVNEDASELVARGVPSPVKGLNTQVDVAGYAGLQSYRTLSDDSMQSADPRLLLKVEVALSADKTQSAQTIGVNVADGLPIVAPFNTFSSISAAEVYYQRPDQQRVPNATLERAHGYSPYWQARLTAVTDQDRKIALALRSTSPPSSFASSQRHQAVEIDIHNRIRQALNGSNLGESALAKAGSESAGLPLTYYRDLERDAERVLTQVNSQQYQHQYQQVLDQADAINARNVAHRVEPRVAPKVAPRVATRVATRVVHGVAPGIEP